MSANHFKGNLRNSISQQPLLIQINHIVSFPVLWFPTYTQLKGDPVILLYLEIEPFENLTKSYVIEIGSTPLI